MPATYEPIATTTLGSATNTITFNSIPGTYTDLRLVFLVNTASASGDPVRLRINNDTGTNYSYTYLDGSGTAAASARATNGTIIPLGLNATTSTTIPTFYTADFFSYAGSTNKTILSTGNADKNGSGYIVVNVGLWRSTAAITRIDLINPSSDFNTGSTATLYGILKA